jgi:type IV conjugative transfer system protein TraE
MRLGPYIEKLDQALWLNRMLQITTLAMSLGILVLARQSTIVHITPPNLRQSYDIGPSTASKEYLEQMASFFTTTALTVSPENAEFAARAFLHHLSTEARGRLETVLLGDAAYVKRNNLTQAFYPRTIDFLGPRKLRVTGQLLQWLAGKVITQRDAAYTLTLEVRNYAVVITDFAYHQEDPPGSSSSDQRARATDPAGQQ